MDAIAIVCCYGLITDTRTEIELKGLLHYYSQVVESLNLRQNEIKNIVLCGGRTALPYTAKSESGTALEFIRGLGILPEELNIMCETVSHTTPENLAFGLLHCRSVLKSNTKIIIYCDEYRKEKVFIEANILFGDYFDFEVISLSRPDIHPNSSRDFQATEKVSMEIKEESFGNLQRLISSIIPKRLGE